MKKKARFYEYFCYPWNGRYPCFSLYFFVFKGETKVDLYGPSVLCFYFFMEYFLTSGNGLL